MDARYLVISLFALISCGGSRAANLRNASASSRIGTTITESARMDASPAIRSCAGPSLCREDVIVTTTPAAVADIEQACARLGGTFGPLRCGREGAAAKCTAGGEYGTVTVFAYDRGGPSADVIERVSSQCEAFEGTFESLK